MTYREYVLQASALSWKIIPETAWFPLSDNDRRLMKNKLEVATVKENEQREYSEDWYGETWR